MLAAKRELFQRYQLAFSSISGVRLMNEPEQCQSNYWLQTLVLDSEQSDRRDILLEATNNAGIMTRPAWVLMHELTPFRVCPRMNLSTAHSLVQRLINIPSSSSLIKVEA